MHRIWFERPLPPAYSQLLDGHATLLGPASATPEEPLRALPTAHAVIASSRIRYDGTLMDLAPALRVISRTGMGIDNVSVPDASARGILVCHAPLAPSISTAEHAITLILAVARRLKMVEHSLERGEKTDYFTEYDGVEIHGLTLGLIGLGQIGGRVARVALALGMRVVAFDPYLEPERVRDVGAEPARDLEELLRAADIISLHVPLTEETYHLINARTLGLCKRGAILVNAARGKLVDETALIAALESGRLYGVGLDVFESEPPPPDHPLLHRDNVVATPHIASATGASKERLWTTAIKQALQVLGGERPAHLANPQIWGERAGQ
jgi:D-3-phosphoglycerate dehydrogenase / 2-oxoglutarate reductase